MAPTVKVRPKPSTAAIVIVAILLLLAYVLVGRRSSKHVHGHHRPLDNWNEDDVAWDPDGKLRSRGGSGSSREGRGRRQENDEEVQDRRRDKKDRGGRDKGRRSKGEKRPSDPQSTKKANPKDDQAKPKRPAPPDYRLPNSPWNDNQPETPGSIRPHSDLPHRKRSPSPRSALKGERAKAGGDPTPNSKKRIRWPAKDTSVDRNPDDVTKAYQKNQESLGLTDRSDEAFPHRPAKQSKPSWLKSSTIPYNYAHVTAENFASFLANSHGELLQKMRAAEKLVEKVDCSRQNDSEGYKEAMADEWDYNLGPLPLIMAECADMIGNLMNEEKVKLAMRIMIERQKYVHESGHATKIDKERSLDKFFARSDMDPKTIPGGPHFARAWFADNYRSVNSREVMGVHNEPFDMPKALGNISHLLQWLEKMGQGFSILRAFSPCGVDLAGLGMRIRLSNEAMRATDPEKWRLDLTYFTWGGPPPPKDREMSETQVWYFRRISLGQGALQNIHTRLSNHPKIEKARHEKRADAVWQVRIVIRPGFSVHGMNIAMAKTEKNVKQHSNHSGPIDRTPEVIVVPDSEDEYEDFLRRVLAAFSRDFERFCPREILFVRRRQFQHDKALTEPGNKGHQFTPSQLAWALNMCGKALQVSKVDTEEGQSDSLPNSWRGLIKRLDLGGYVPLNPFRKFISLAGYPGLKELVLPYLPTGNGDTSTAQLLLDEKRGSRGQSGRLYVFLAFRKQEHVPQLAQEIEHWLIGYARSRLRGPSGALKYNEVQLRAQAREEAEDLRLDALSKVRVFIEKPDAREDDVSNHARFPVQLVKLNFPPDLLDEGPRGGEAPRGAPPPQGGGQRPAAPPGTGRGG